MVRVNNFEFRNSNLEMFRLYVLPVLSLSKDAPCLVLRVLDYQTRTLSALRSAKSSMGSSDYK